jgi:predicted glycoside hydrolase/deacetylase ChbG (UPF0249 family)
MLIINADDWGRSRRETDAAVSCYRASRINSATAMVFMADSERSAELARDLGIELGLHLNLTEPFSGEGASARLRERHERLARFLRLHRLAGQIYNPARSADFEYVFKAQLEEFMRLYGKPPSHFDGHQHQHLCMNMLVDEVIPRGSRVRRSFFFWPGEKSLMNRTYRSLVDRWLMRRYKLADYFFALSQSMGGNRIEGIVDLARSSTVEIMTHPASPTEYAYLMGDQYVRRLHGVRQGTYRLL